MVVALVDPVCVELVVAVVHLGSELEECEPPVHDLGVVAGGGPRGQGGLIVGGGWSERDREGSLAGVGPQAGLGTEIFPGVPRDPAEGRGRARGRGGVVAIGGV